MLSNRFRVADSNRGQYDQRVAAKSSKRLPPAMEQSVARFVKDIVEHDFPKNAAGKPKGQRAIAERIGISQPVLSQCLTYDPANPTALGIGINGLLALRKYSHQTIDAILGLELPSRAVEARADIDRLLEITAELGRTIEFLTNRPSANSKMGKALREVEKIRMRVAHEKATEERIRRVNEASEVAGRRIA